VKGIARSLAAVAVTVTLVGASIWGCASQSHEPERDWRHFEPDGGWQSFRPTEPRRYDVDPMEAGLGPISPGVPSTAPMNPVAPGLH
jgi:hypothetical protein